jgi:hypothetical protein
MELALSESEIDIAFSFAPRSHNGSQTMLIPGNNSSFSRRRIVKSLGAAGVGLLTTGATRAADANLEIGGKEVRRSRFVYRRRGVPHGRCRAHLGACERGRCRRQPQTVSSSPVRT